MPFSVKDGEQEPLLNEKRKLALKAPRPVSAVVTPVTNMATLHLQSTNTDNEPFCSIYALFFFMGMFISPLFLICGMLGMSSNKAHERWAGKASSIAGIVYGIVVALFLFMYCMYGSSTTWSKEDDYSEY